jgi:hypothetical protein
MTVAVFKKVKGATRLKDLLDQDSRTTVPQSHQVRVKVLLDVRLFSIKRKCMARPQKGKHQKSQEGETQVE